MFVLRWKSYDSFLWVCKFTAMVFVCAQTVFAKGASGLAWHGNRSTERRRFLFFAHIFLFGRRRRRSSFLLCGCGIFVAGGGMGVFVSVGRSGVGAFWAVLTIRRGGMCIGFPVGGIGLVTLGTVTAQRQFFLTVTHVFFERNEPQAEKRDMKRKVFIFSRKKIFSNVADPWSQRSPIAVRGKESTKTSTAVRSWLRRTARNHLVQSTLNEKISMMKIKRIKLSRSVKWLSTRRFSNMLVFLCWSSVRL